MAPTVVNTLNPRDVYCDGYGCYNNGWSNWGRWVALVFIILFFFMIAFWFSRRRHRQGRQPAYATGWVQPNHQNKPPGYGDPNFHPPPPYQGTQATGTTFNSNDGYYGGHGAPSGSYELQQPSSSYQPPRGTGGDPVYAPPAGPPPNKSMWGSNTNDHVIR